MSLESLDITQLYKYLFGALLVLVIAIVYLKRKARRKSGILKQVKKKKGHNYLYPFTMLFMKFPLFSKSFEKNKKRVQLIYPGEIMAINQKVTKDMLVAIVSSIVVLLVFLFTSRGDLYYIAFGLLISYVFYSSIINICYEFADKNLLEQFYNYLSNIRHNYYQTGKKIDDTVYNSITESPGEISLHAEKIHKILTSIEMQAEIDKYVRLAPNRFIMSFLAIATSIMEYSDKILSNGKSMLITNIGYLKDEVHNELVKIRMNKQLFSMRSFLAIFPVFLVKPIQFWANNALPEIKDYYTGVYGITCEIILFVLSMVAYTMVNKLKDTTQQNIKEHKFLQGMSKWPIVSPILTKEVNRNFSKAQRMNDKLKLTGEHMGYKQFILKQFLTAILLFLGFQLIMITSIWQEKKNILSDYADAFSSSFIADEAYEEEMQKTAQVYIKTIQNSPMLAEDKEALVQDIIANSEVKKPLMAEMVADTVISKFNTYNNVFYKWWYLLISIFIAFIGFKAPNLILEYQVRAIRMNMEDEVGQFQTIVMMLMHVDNMSIRIILEWLERFSYCFRESIQTCINELPSDEEKALKKLRDSETFEPFKRFVNNMLIVNEQGIEAAFNEIVQERENSMEDRKKDNEEVCKKKANYATLICIVPTLFLIAVYLLYPIYELTSALQGSISF